MTLFLSPNWSRKTVGSLRLNTLEGMPWNNLHTKEKSLGKKAPLTLNIRFFVSPPLLVWMKVSQVPDIEP
jgi:hypothetical protein